MKTKKRVISLTGNPNCGKTTLFNELTGSQQYVGNWPGVTVEHKHGYVKGDEDLELVDLPGLYSLSPYSPEELVARGHLLEDSPDVILNIIDATQLERSLYLTTQLMDLGLPIIVALNMSDSLAAKGLSIDTAKLEKDLGCPVVQLSALKQDGLPKLLELLKGELPPAPNPKYYSEILESVISEIQGRFSATRWEAQHLLQLDHDLLEKKGIHGEDHIYLETKRLELEKEGKDEADSYIAAERFRIIESIVAAVRTENELAEKAQKRIEFWDGILTHPIFGFAIFAAMMWCIYYVAITTLGDWATGWTNDVLFGDIVGEWLSGFISDAAASIENLQLFCAVVSTCLLLPPTLRRLHDLNKNGAWIYVLITPFVINYVSPGLPGVFNDIALYGLLAVNALFMLILLLKKGTEGRNRYGIGTENKYTRLLRLEGRSGRSEYAFNLILASALSLGITALGTLQLNLDIQLQSLIMDGIVAGVGAVMGFLPQMLILFLMLTILEDIGYMARVAFMLERILRAVGLPGKAFIPMLVSMGCGIPGVMATRTIEGERDRRLTIMLTTFVPCGAKLPIIAMFALLFGQDANIATIAYFAGFGSIILGGLILSKLHCFKREESPFMMELPSYHLPSATNINLRVMERCKSFAIKAGTVIFISSAIIWGTSSYDWKLNYLGSEDLDNSALADVGKIAAPIFQPLGWGEWKPAVASITGLVAKENVVGTFGVLYADKTEEAEEEEEGGEEEEEAYRTSNLKKTNALTALSMLAWEACSESRDMPVDPELEEEEEEEDETEGVVADIAKAGAFTTLSGISFMLFNLLCAPCFAACGAIHREMNRGRWTIFAIGYMCVWAYVIAFITYQLGLLAQAGAFHTGQVTALILLLAILYAIFRKPAVNCGEPSTNNCRDCTSTDCKH